MERGFIHTGVGFEAQLTCVVHAEPQPHVIWYKDTTQLGTTEQHSQQVLRSNVKFIYILCSFKCVNCSQMSFQLRKLTLFSNITFLWKYSNKTLVFICHKKKSLCEQTLFTKDCLK